MILSVTLNPCIDRTIYIDKMRVGETIRASQSRLMAGGKGNNAARLIKNLGEEVHCLNFLGGHTGKIIQKLITEKDGILLDAVWTRAPSREAVTVLEESGRWSAFIEPGFDVTPALAEELKEKFRSLIKSARLVIFCGSVPTKALSGIYFDLIQEANAAGVISIIDSYGEALARAIEARPFMVRANLAEASGLIGKELDTDTACWEALDFIQKPVQDSDGALQGFEEKGIEAVVISLGPKGALARWGKRCIKILSPPVKAGNPVGSGDALTGAIAVGLVRGEPAEEALRLGMAAATASTTHWDACACSKEEAEKFLRLIKITEL